MNKKFTFLAIFIIAFISVAITDKSFQNDTFYIIKVGESILHNGIDMLDHFSIHNIMYPYEHWLYNIFIYLIYYSGGLTAVYLSTICLCFILGLIIYICNQKMTNNQLVSLIITILIIALSKSFITARAQLVSYILFVLEIYFIECLLKSNKKRYCIYLIVISWLIANMHSAVWPMFIIFFMPYLFTNILYWYRNKKINIKKWKMRIYKDKGKFLLGFDHADSINNKVIFDRYDNVKLLFITLVLCLSIALLTPNHFQPYTYYLKVILGNTTNFIAEHQPTVIFDCKGYLFILTIIIMYLIFVKVKIHIKDLLMLLGLTLLSISSFRHISLFLIIGSFSFIRLFSDYFSIYANNTYKLLIKKITNSFIYYFIILFVVLLCTIAYIINIKDQKYVYDSIYPVKAATFINKNVDKENMRLYNDYDYGSYLIYRNIKVFIDSRASLYTRQFNKLDDDIVDDYFDVVKHNNYKKVFRKYSITHVLIFKDSALDKLLQLDNDYIIIYQDKNFILFEKIK